MKRPSWNLFSELVLPSAEGYHHCSSCNRWIASSNAHCEKCKACTSKVGISIATDVPVIIKYLSFSIAYTFNLTSLPIQDGRTYVHCNLCQRCVKPSYKHCQTCARCKLPDHQCSQPDNPGIKNGEKAVPHQVLKERKPTMGGKRVAPAEGQNGPKSKRKKLKQKGKKIYYGSKNGQKKRNKQWL